jgi:hypoxanthine phosphoribosyltransferase
MSELLIKTPLANYVGTKPYRFRPLVSAAEIAVHVERLGAELRRDYAGKYPVLVGVLNGGFMFMADLMRAMMIECDIDFMKLSSYRQEMSSGDLVLLKTADVPLAGRHIILVEDIVDTGKSLDYLRRYLRDHEPASLAMVAMFVKESALQMNRKPEYYGKLIPDDFVVGYGLDHAGQWRYLPDLYVLIEEDRQS